MFGTVAGVNNGLGVVGVNPNKLLKLHIVKVGSQIRTSLDKSAPDLGAAGRDVHYGYGLVQARAAYDRIKSLGCGK